ncbi:MAG: hypothetical protein LBJ67_00780 [Planctomycetaceae bacterium]|jgi:predicted peptidase|nr:hypothetical protein [Planctomycetaceae bacterium]
MIVTQCPSDNRDWNTSKSSEGKGDAPITIAGEILNAVIEEYPIDENRLNVFGICSGGNAAWNFVAMHPKRFASLGVCSSAPPMNHNDFLFTSIWAFNNKNDSVSWESMERFINAINASGGNAYLTLKDRGGHNSWKNALYNEKVIGWMLLQNRQWGGLPVGESFYHRSTKTAMFLFGMPFLFFLSFFVISKIQHIRRKTNER